jgi:hypothetical protein
MTQEFPLMRKATAIWLIENTGLTFSQIANFCGMHEIEIQGIADGDVASEMIGQDPCLTGQLTQQEIKRCENDVNAKLKLNSSIYFDLPQKKTKKEAKYTPIARRQDKPDAIAFLLKYHPELSIDDIKKLIGTTDTTANAIKNKTHWDIKNIRPRDVILLGFCTQSQLNQAIEKAKERIRITAEQSEIQKNKLI